MNRLLVHYGVDVQYPEVSGAEHLEMLQLRDRLAELEPKFLCQRVHDFDASSVVH